MNFVAFGFLLICCPVWASEIGDYYRYAAGNRIESLLEEIKGMLKTGNETLGIPVLDPFTSAQESIKIDEEIITLDALLTDINVRRLSEYNVNNGDFQIGGFKLSVNLTWPLINAETNYAMDGIADNSIPIYGTGTMNIKAHHFTFGMDVSFKTEEKHFIVKDIASTVSLKELDFKITGLLDDEEFSELMSSLVSDIVPQIIEDYQEDITSKVNAFAREMIDGFLSTKTVAEIIKIIMG